MTSVMLTTMFFESRKINSMFENRCMAGCFCIHDDFYLRRRGLVNCDENVRIPWSTKVLSGKPKFTEG